MIKAPNNWSEVHATENRRKIVPGGYVVKILKAETIVYPSGWNGLVMELDIAEGDYKDFYKDDFKAQTGEYKKWKGIYRQGIPAEDCSADDMTARNFKGMITAIEHSNSGYTWAWDEKSLEGKIVGCLFRSEEYDYNGFHGWKTVPMMFVSADRIREGKYEVPAPKPLKAKPEPLGTPKGFDAVSDEDIPF